VIISNGKDPEEYTCALTYLT